MSRVKSVALTLIAGLLPSTVLIAANTAVATAVGSPYTLATCAACHGVSGEGKAPLGAPRLAGLPAAYLRNQLLAFAQDRRADTLMTPIAKTLSAAEMESMAAAYARMRTPAAAPRNSAATAVADRRGDELAIRGRWTEDLPGCVQCHGSAGSGVGEGFPPLSGQPVQYLTKQLHDWQQGRRDPGPLGLMEGIAAKLSASDIEAVASYFSVDRQTEPAPAPVPAPSPGPAVTKPGVAAGVGGEFAPPQESSIPRNEFGDMVRLGMRIFEDPKQYAHGYVGNSLSCANCHLDAGRKADSAPLWAAYVSYPAYREKNHRVMTFDERLQDCFRYSMNGKAPPLGSATLIALDTYAFWLATGAVIDPHLKGRGYPTVSKSVAADAHRGAAIYTQRCALCHGTDGAGQKAGDGTVAFPALWGADSYNWGAGMANLSRIAGFIKANMPLSQPNTVSDRDAYDLAAYIDGHERPQDPRFKDSVQRTRALFHDTDDSLYGTSVDGHVLGSAHSGVNR